MKGCKVLLLFGFTLCLVTALVNCNGSEDEIESEEEDYLDDDLEDEPGQHGQGHPGQGPSGQGPSGQGPSGQGPSGQGPPRQEPPRQEPPRQESLRRRHTGEESPSRLEKLELDYKSLKETLEFIYPGTPEWTDKYKELERLEATIKQLKK